MYGLTDKEEILNYLDRFYNRLLEHRYRYYVLNHPVLEDFAYDWMEKHYNELAREHGAKEMDMVDFDFNDSLALEAGKRVDLNQDSYSLWEAEMKPIWDKLGYPRYEDERK